MHRVGWATVMGVAMLSANVWARQIIEFNGGEGAPMPGSMSAPVVPEHDDLRPDQTLILPAADPEVMPKEIAPDSPEGRLPGAIVDEAANVAYVVGETGVVEAVDLKTGRTLFASAAEARPLALADGKLYVLTYVMNPQDRTRQIVVRAMSIKGQGKYVFESQPLAVPEWVMDGDVSSLIACGKVAGGNLKVGWLARGRETIMTMVPVKGAKTQRPVRIWKESEPNEVTAGGVAVVNLKTGENVLPKAKVEGEEAAEEDAAENEELQTPEQMMKLAGILVIDEQKPMWAQATGRRKGMEFTLATRPNGLTDIVCRDPKREWTRWRHPLSASPGLTPACPVVEHIKTREEEEAEREQQEEMQQMDN